MSIVIKKTTTIETTYDCDGKVTSKKEIIVEEEIKNDDITNMPYHISNYPKTNLPWITVT